jgi:hypothetical protein
MVTVKQNHIKPINLGDGTQAEGRIENKMQTILFLPGRHIELGQRLDDVQNSILLFAKLEQPSGVLPSPASHRYKALGVKGFKQRLDEYVPKPMHVLLPLLSPAPRREWTPLRHSPRSFPSYRLSYTAESLALVKSLQLPQDRLSTVLNSTRRSIFTQHIDSSTNRFS